MWPYIRLIVLIAITAAIACPHTSNAINTSSKGESVSSSAEIDSEIERLTSEKNKRQGRAEKWDRLNIVCIFLAGFAAVGLVITSIGVSRSNGDLNRTSDELNHAKDLKADGEIARLNNEAGDARKSAGDAIERAAKLEKQAAELNRKAEEERMARLKLEEKMADRHLTPEQQSAIAQQLQPFSGQSVNLFAYTAEGEVVGISHDLIAALAGQHGARWIIHAFMGQEVNRAIRGILVEVSPDASPQSIAAAKALVAALISERMATDGPILRNPNVATMGMGDSDPHAQIIITIGKRP
jgi:hypothetical protein